jgi:4-azaleucine resistance transporter AzlC
MSPQAKSFWAGVRAEFPLLIGVFPFGLIYGALALRAGLAPSAGQAMSLVVFAGAAQFIAVQLVHENAAGVVIVLTIAIVNLRHILYSAAIAPYLKQLSLRWKSLLSYLLTDEAFAATIVQYEVAGLTPSGHWFFLGAGCSLWLVWQLSSALGIFLGTTIPPDWPLELALPLTFVAMLMPMLKDRAVVATAVVAGGIAVIAYGLPYKLGLMLAALIGIGVGVVMEASE